MRILMCNSFYYMRGGSEKYMFELTRLLESHGHDVIPFGMQHEKNLATPYSKYFVSYVDYPSLLKDKFNPPQIFKALARLFYSRESQEKIERLIRDTRPDIAHLHGIGHEISPSILDVLHAHKIPVVQTLHDYGALCPNTNYVSHGKVCERCRKRRYYYAFLKRCKRNSLGASLLASLTQYYHSISQVYARNIDAYISPSKFLREKLVENGVTKPITVIPNFISMAQYKNCETGKGYGLYFGRLVPIKGLRTLVNAAKINPQFRIMIAGDGELASEISEMIACQHIGNVTLVGHVEGEALISLVANANFTIIPSEWYENYPMSIIESFACAKPVIASNIGALPDLVIDNYNGLLFEPGNAVQLSNKIKYLFEHPNKATLLGKNGLRAVMANNDPEQHFQKIMNVYETVLQRCPKENMR